jgi:hypothetical protein
MRKLIKTPIAVALSALSFLPALSTPPAHAVGGLGAALIGSGSVSPGLTAMPATHAWEAWLNGPAAGVVVGSQLPAGLTCSVGWTSVPGEQLGAGAGLGGYTCWTSPSTKTWGGAIAVVRTGAVVSITFAGSMVGTATCVLVPFQNLPDPAVHEYSLTCADAAVDVI